MSGGTEKRDQILPNVPIEDTGFILPEYDFAGNVIPPYGINISDGGSIQHVIDAAKGVIYYSDVIAFGQNSSELTRNLQNDGKYNKLGINFFMKSGLICSNGAGMSTYFEGIPKGDALGKRLQTVMEIMRLPPLKGIAPGMLEDTKAAMNIKPVLQSAFGNVYPVCEKRTLPVGDYYGRTEDPESGDVWVKGPVDFINGVATQTRWVQKVNRKGDLVFISREEWENTPKTINLDGTKKTLPPEDKTEEGFEDENGKVSLLIGIVLLSISFAIVCSGK